MIQQNAGLIILLIATKRLVINSGRPEYYTYVNGVREADYLFDTRFHFGEWLEPNSGESGDPSEQDLEAAKKRTELKNKSGLNDKPETQFGFWLFLMKEIQLS
jgi:hypothetical protein